MFEFSQQKSTYQTDKTSKLVKINCEDKLCGVTKHRFEFTDFSPDFQATELIRTHISYLIVAKVIKKVERLTKS